MSEVVKTIDKDGTHWLPGPRHIHCQEHILNLAAQYFIDGVTPTPQATLLCKICHAINHDEDTDITSLTEQLAALEHDSEAIVEDGFNVSDTVGKALALIEQIHKSLQAQVFFKKSCEEEGVAVCEILTWVRTCWASLFKCLECSLSLCLTVNRFTLLADKSHEVPKLHNKSYSNFKLNQANWRKIQLVHDILKEPATAQQSFSSVTSPTAWQTLLTLECLASTWGMMAENPEYAIIVDAIRKGLKNVEKFYQKASDSGIYFICLVLDPNYKLAYVER
ncbi:hypothetical protein BDR05DRAFT_995137 [Suillus weaverae]|nr:hypothetical protein BDR05DRAFT_995137 [Suillus weaverae]